MPSTLALFLTLGFMAFLFRRDFREKPNVTGSLWLPTLWMIIMASRPPGQWLRIVGVPVVGRSWEEGNPLDAAVFLLLTVAGIVVLYRRRVSVAEVVRDNAWLTVFVLYCFIAIVWSDFPFVSFKRWIKVLGHPVMALIILSEPDPKEAFLRVMKRIAYVVLPVSILWMKYYPTLGRAASEWGAMMNCGISSGKNALGGICMVLGLVFLWHLLHVLRAQRSAARRNELYLMGGLLLMIAYLLWKAHSATSWTGLLLSVIIMVILGLRAVNKKVIGAYAVAGIVILVIAQLTFDIYGKVVDVSGHETTIEGRGRIWEILLQTDTNPIFGTGFESFWLGERREKIWEQLDTDVGQAHNGYLEMYLNLGIVGLCIFSGVIIATFRKMRLDLLTNFEWGQLRLSLLVAILAHNWTEAGFRGLSLTFFMFFLIAIDYRTLGMVPLQASSETDSLEREPEFVHSYGTV
jgi:exopolysaccharide production protein ExoQ